MWLLAVIKLFTLAEQTSKTVEETLKL